MDIVVIVILVELVHEFIELNLMQAVVVRSSLGSWRLIEVDLIGIGTWNVGSRILASMVFLMFTVFIALVVQHGHDLCL